MLPIIQCTVNHDQCQEEACSGQASVMANTHHCPWSSLGTNVVSSVQAPLGNFPLKGEILVFSAASDFNSASVELGFQLQAWYLCISTGEPHQGPLFVGKGINSSQPEASEAADAEH